MSFITTVLLKSGRDWLALCLENGITSQGETKERAIEKLKEAVISYDAALKLKEEGDVYNAPISVKELHEFLTFDKGATPFRSYELRAVYI